MIFDENYWSLRYKQQATGWDTGGITPPLKAYFDQLEDRSIRILIPGAGNAYEAEYLHHLGFTQVIVLDVSPIPLESLQQRVPDFPKDHLVEEDFFEHKGSYDLIVEQTFFCALHPSQREAYVHKMKSLLNPGGKLMGLLFTIPLNEHEPPFGGTREEYDQLFRPHFKKRVFETAYNSIAPRAGNELFILLEKVKGGARSKGGSKS